ncbi:MAG: Maf family protein [Luminiphilus sp.]|nr:Maf family protein [Luminiphilus sp.]
MNRPETLVLASTSAYRAELLGRLGLSFEIQRVTIDESCKPSESSLALSQRLSVEKAKAVTNLQGDYLSIGSDQVAACDNRLLGKPGSEALAHKQLSFISNKTVQFFTGVALWRPQKALLDCRVVQTQVSMRDLSDAEITAYIARDQPLDCAGSFKWEALGISLFRSTKASDPTALQGLPLIELSHMLRGQGYRIP